MVQVQKILLSSLLVLIACNQPNTNSSTQPSKKSNTISKDTLNVNTKAAIFFIQDSTQIELRKKNTNEDDFYVVADDAMYYLSLAREFVDTIKLNKIELSNEKFIQFIEDNKNRTLIKIDTLKALCGVYFFEPSKKPYLIDLTKPKEAYKNYFKQ